MANEPSVFALICASRCFNCDRKLEPGAIVRLQNGRDEREVLCQACAGLQDFVVVAAGNAKVTTLAKKYSATRYLVMKWSPLWKCYERQGLLVEQQAVEKIEAELDIKVR